MSYVAKLAIVLGLITAVAAGGLAYTYQLTAEQIAGQVEQAKEDALRAVLPGATSFREEAETLLAAQEDNPALHDVTAMYSGTGPGGEVGTAYSVTVTGYGGPIVMMVGVDASGEISGIKIIDAAQETPGLGAKIKDPAFQDQFGGKTALEPLALVKVQTSAANEVQAIAAATLSSSAVLRAVNAATGVYRAAAGGGGGQLARAMEDAAMSIFPEADSIEADLERLQAALAADPLLSAATDLFTVYSGGTSIGTAVAAEGEGYGGRIVALVGFDPAGNVAGVRFVSLSGETVGLGSRIAESGFTAHFAGRPAGEFKVTKSAPTAPDEIQALAGATVSTRGAVDAVNSAVRLYIRLGSL